LVIVDFHFPDQARNFCAERREIAANVRAVGDLIDAGAPYLDQARLRREGKCSPALGALAGKGAGAVAGTGEIAIAFRRSAAPFSIPLTLQIAQESASPFRA
jgi:hypothetical protein